MNNKFLPINKSDMKQLGWEQLDFILINADAYVDHPSFGGAIISRVLEAVGYKVGIIAQPNWKSVDDFKKLGKPRLAFLVSGGNIDPMVNHYTVNKKRRRRDSYSPGGKMDCRPDRATIVYCNMLKQAYKDVPIIVGGIESSLRRFAHYDYWSNSVRRSILLDSRADLLIYGMGEKSIMDIAECLNSGMDIKYIRHVSGTCYTVKDLNEVYDCIEIPSFKEITESKKKYAQAFKIQYEEQDAVRGKALAQKHNDVYLVQNPPTMVLSTDELDWVYSLPYARNYHPIYEKDGGIPAIDEVKFSIASSRGCYGGCSFCALTFHQGRIVQGRSHESILNEAKELTSDKDFKGYIHDVGGPTANFRAPACDKQLKVGTCKNRQCLFPNPCKNLKVSHCEYTDLLTKLRKLPNIKKVFVRSGLRYDYIMADKDDRFLYDLCKNHVSGQLKVAPEHVAEEVLELMGKPKKEIFDKFTKKFYDINKKLGKEQYLIPYLMSSHPGSTLKSAIKLAEYLRDIHYQPEQVQDFYPTPGTLSTTMFYTGLDPTNGRKVYVPKDKKEKAMQRALLQFSNPHNYNLVFEALSKAGRRDLIGYGPKCLIRPKKKEEINKVKAYNNKNKRKRK
ncbi:YgiQ family radical SAM protein [Abyssisolibacter fermentans]|uniref:YgiQ family radical SAM protein n=1 Tax=Abyssisolibacter fermentans TaxID=1766203 RepID=UPI0008302631|nr:YgiQ family radical SAM protein [Abyssisolibacter fermentans]